MSGNMQKIIDGLRRKNITPKGKSKIYGKYYYPYYNGNVELQDKEHDIYNAQGEKMRTYFIRDAIFAHIPYFESKHFIWDRYNFGLKNHFYTQKYMLETMGNPDKRYGMLIESETITPDDYKLFDKYKGLEKDFDAIFTHSSYILEKLDNAKFVPFCSILCRNDFDDELYKKKTKSVSILSSNKLECPLHKYRYTLAWQCKKEGLADTYGTFDNGPLVNINETLEDYRFSICIENDVKPYFFTERIITAFANQTIPIYIGATKIDNFFNPDGIIKITTESDIKKVLSQCTQEEYESRLSAVLDNYNRVKNDYTNPYDYMYEKYLINV